MAIEVALDEGGDEIPELESKLEAVRAAIVELGGVPLVSKDSGRFGARFWVRAPGTESAVERGVEALQEAAATAGLPAGPVVEVEASTLEELSHDGSGGEVPPLIGITELAEILGVSHQLVTVLVRAKGFPVPAAELNAGPVWTLSSVNRFIRRAQVDPDAVEPSTRPG